MNQVKVIGYTAIAISIVTLVACFIIAPTIHAEITNVWKEIDEEIREFKVKESNESKSVFEPGFESGFQKTSQMNMNMDLNLSKRVE